MRVYVQGWGKGTPGGVSAGQLRLGIGQEAGSPPPSSHTTVHTVPYTAVPVSVFRFWFPSLMSYKHPTLPHGFRPLLNGFQGPLARHLPKTIRKCTLDALTGSALRRQVRATTMASADFCRPIPAPFDAGSSKADWQTSQGNARDLHPTHPPHLLPQLPDGIGLRVFWPSRPVVAASYAVPVRRARTLLTASFRFRLATDTLAVRVTVPTDLTPVIVPVCD